MHGVVLASSVLLGDGGPVCSEGLPLHDVRLSLELFGLPGSLTSSRHAGLRAQRREPASRDRLSRPFEYAHLLPPCLMSASPIIAPCTRGGNT